MPIDTLLLKVTIMPTVIIMVTLISRRWGNLIGGIIAGMPWVGGAILLFIALEQGKLFAIDMLPAATVGLIAWLGFCMTYVWLGQRIKPILTLIGANVVCLLLGATFRHLTDYLPLYTWTLVLLASLILSMIYFPKVIKEVQTTHGVIKHEIALRVIMITLFVIALTYFANLLGPSWSGILTPFPVITATLALFTHIGQGIRQVKVILLGMYTGVVGFGSFLFALSFLLPHYTLGISFLIALIINVILALTAKYVFSQLGLI